MFVRIYHCVFVCLSYVFVCAYVFVCSFSHFCKNSKERRNRWKWKRCWLLIDFSSPKKSLKVWLIIFHKYNVIMIIRDVQNGVLISIIIIDANYHVSWTFKSICSIVCWSIRCDLIIVSNKTESASILKFASISKSFLTWWIFFSALSYRYILNLEFLFSYSTVSSNILEKQAVVRVS